MGVKFGLTPREERGLRVFMNRVPKSIFGREMDEVTMEWRRLHNEELFDLYSSPNFVLVMKYRRMEWAAACGTSGGQESCVEGFGKES
jgi:hypothetical protein